MKKQLLTLALAAAAIATAGAGSALAQTRAATRAPGAAAGKPEDLLKVKSITKPGASCLVPSPVFDGKVRSPGRNSSAKKKWAQFEVEYTTKAEWTDAITFTFHVMSMDDEKTPHYYSTSVTYLDVAKGDHGACVMLPPSAVLRYGTPMAYGVEIEIDGKTVASGGEGQWKDTQWWTKLDAVKKLERHSGQLQDRSKTPFGLTFIDEYEAVR
ncbi:MAG: hypothetical protein IJP66_06875 [Kiritimatiellae bacterium]|nr:hypothetical protein [Kiritimatiellia bacterium]